MKDLETYIIEMVKQTGLSKREIQQMMHKKQSSSRKVISEKSALFLVENGQKFKKAGHSQEIPKEYLIIEE